MKILRRYFYIIVIAFIALLHFAYLPNGFIGPDHTNIERGHAVVPMSSWPIIFFSRYSQTSFYRPIVTLLNSLDFDAYGRMALGFHLTNVLLHMGVVLATPFFCLPFLNFH